MKAYDGNSPAKTIGYAYHVLNSSGISPAASVLIIEEPLLITIAGKSMATLMCTPGDEISLTLGYLLTEGIISSLNDIGAIAFCREESGNVVQVLPAAGTDLLSRLKAYRTVFSSCSICGSEAIQAVTSFLRPFAKQGGRVSPEVIFELGECMNSKQEYFRTTGGTHAAVLGQIKERRFVAESAILKEDIGRHNALDKVVGEALQRKTSFADSVLF
jgi:FdhD protein